MTARYPTTREAEQTNWLSLPFVLFLVLLTYDGAVRKWALPAAEQIIFLIKDALLLLLLVLYALSGRDRTSYGNVPSLVQLFLGAYCIVVVISAFNLALPNLLVGLWGVKSHLLYIGLVILIPPLFRTLPDAFDQLTRYYPWVTIPTSGLAMVQVTLPTDHFLNAYVRDTVAVATFGDEGLARVSGPFSYITGMAAFVVVSALIGLWLYLIGKRSPLLLLAFAFAAAALPLTGSRSVIAIVGTSACMMMLASLTARIVTMQGLLGPILALIVLVGIGMLAQDATWQALQQRTEANDDVPSRIIATFWSAIENFDRSGWFGFGSGAANFGALALTPGSIPFYWVPGGYSFEEESGRLVLELGIVGWVVSMLMRCTLAIWSLSLLVKGATRACRLTAVLATPNMILAIYQGNGVFAASYTAVTYWFCVGLLALAQHEHIQWRAMRSIESRLSPVRFAHTRVR